MKLGVFVSDYKITVDTLQRFKAEKLGIILVANGVYHALIKENGKNSSILDLSENLYALSEDVETRGYSTSDLNSKVKAITYNDLVDIIFNDYEKLAWL